jgi:exosortase A
MPPEALPIPPAWRGALASLPQPWRSALLRLTIAWAALLLLFWSDWQAMGDQWWNISTYNHVLLIPAIVAWLVAQRAAQLAPIEPEGWWPGLIVVAGAALLWALGAFAGLSIARQYGAVTILIASALTILGPRVGAALAFPLGYMLLLVPFGDELVPPLQMITAAITIGLVHLSGIPATIDGVFIHTPAGLFEVAEACSGVKFLIAMISFGILVANLCFLRWPRRGLFLAVCIVVPILANGVRAWGTIFAAQYYGAEAAAGFDHIVYGWIFFAVVIAAVLALSWRHFDRSIDEPPISGATIAASPIIARMAERRIGWTPALLVVAALALICHGWARAADALEAPLPDRIALPDVPGWHRVDYAPQVRWEPRAGGADHRLLGRYQDAQGRQVDVFLALYSAQDEGREAGGFGQGALPPGGEWSWLSPGPAIDDAKGDRLLAQGRIARLSMTWYRTGDLLTGSNARLKLANIRDRLLLRTRPTAVLILSVEEGQGAAPAAGASIAAFRQATGPLGPWMDRVAGVR